MKETMKKAKNWLKGKANRAAVALSVAVTALAGTAFAAEGETTTDVADSVVTALTNGVQTFAGKAGTLIGVMIVAAIPIAGGLWLARRAFSWFKGMAK